MALDPTVCSTGTGHPAVKPTLQLPKTVWVLGSAPGHTYCQLVERIGMLSFTAHNTSLSLLQSLRVPIRQAAHVWKYARRERQEHSSLLCRRQRAPIGLRKLAYPQAMAAMCATVVARLALVLLVLHNVSAQIKCRGTDSVEGCPSGQYCDGWR